MFDYRNSDECKTAETHEHYHSDNDVCLSDGSCIAADLQQVCGLIQKFFEVSVDEIVFPAEGGEFEFYVKSSAAWDIEFDGKWLDGSKDLITIEYDKEVGKTVIKMKAEENLNGARTAYIVFKSRNGSVTIPIRQNAYVMGFMTADGYWLRMSNGALLTRKIKV